MKTKPQDNRRKFLAGALAATGAAVLSHANAAEKIRAGVGAPVLKRQPSMTQQQYKLQKGALKLRLRPMGDSSKMVNNLARKYNVKPDAVRGIMKETAIGYRAYLKSHVELRGISAAV